MINAKKIAHQSRLGLLFFIILLFFQCARRGSPTGGPKDITPPVLLKVQPENLTKNFKDKSIKFYFDEYVKLKDIQNQLIISPPLANQPIIQPQGVASKTIEFTLQDTLKPNTTYTLNFGQSVIDNNEGNVYNNLTYVFSTGSTIDSLSIKGIVTDALNRNPDDFISVMLYEIDSTYNDSTLYKRPPNYLTNTLDSLPIFNLNYLKRGKYFLFALKDGGKKNVFNQGIDKIAFLKDTITLPTDSIFALSLFKEIPDFDWSIPSQVSKNQIVFGYRGLSDGTELEVLTQLPDSIHYKIRKDKEKDSLNFWIQNNDLDSIVFLAKNNLEQSVDTFIVKTRKQNLDSLTIRTSHTRNLSFLDSFYYQSNTPIVGFDSTKISVVTKDSLPVVFDTHWVEPDDRVFVYFDKKEEQEYHLTLLPKAIENLFGMHNDTLITKLKTGKVTDYGTLELTLTGAVHYPMLAQLINKKGEVYREMVSKKPGNLLFDYIEPGTYEIRVVFDENENGKWDTGRYLEKRQPEKVVYYPDKVEVRANWELPTIFTLQN